ncbi:MAG: c-type cytochrome [Chloroflexi bacterium]|nr:c-type cytochrome [Chloroflexota bacterium]
MTSNNIFRSIAGAFKAHPLRYCLISVCVVLAIGAFTIIAVSAIASQREQAARQAEIDALLTAALGGDTTAFTYNRNAFSLSARNLTNLERRQFEVGDSFFNQNWVTAPASTDARDGLGPTFNAQSCSSCHTLDGRASPPLSNDDPERGLLFRLSIPGTDSTSGPVADPNYGGQLQDRAILKVQPEGRFLTTWAEIPGTYADGERYTLMKPEYSFDELAFGEMHPQVMISPRIAPVVFGMGLLEAIPESDILAQADPEDTDGDGISGRANIVWDVSRQTTRLGRFGWKANVPSVEQQVAGAFNGDIGITSSLFPDENCPAGQTECATAPNGGSPEVPDSRLDLVTFYNRTLAVPAMRDIDDPQVRDGAALFLNAGCNVCHTPSYTTGTTDIDALSEQVIFPYTDLLLHDMGDGLADGRPDFLADGREWRTPPLWGIGLVDNVNGHTRFMHDGRARNLAEAILWHDGEGAAAKEAFRNYSREEREALLRFLNSL